jgi:hypothetical protein
MASRQHRCNAMRLAWLHSRQMVAPSCRTAWEKLPVDSWGDQLCRSSGGGEIKWD